MAKKKKKKSKGKAAKGKQLGDDPRYGFTKNVKKKKNFAKG